MVDFLSLAVWLVYAASGLAALLVTLTLCVTFCGRGADPSSPRLFASIAQFYDATSSLWERVWGEHMHHGWYGADGKADVQSHQQAQIDMIDQTLAFGGITAAWAQERATASPDGVVRVLDDGCGVGGSARHIARFFKAAGVDVDVIGISLSPQQVASAKARTRAAELDSSVHFEVGNAMSLRFPDNHFDLVWSMESGEHMPNKHGFLSEATRVLKPRGKFLMATWCHRNVSGARGPLASSEKYHLKLLSRNYCLPKWVPVSTYVRAASECRLEHVVTEDWTPAILPFWPAVVRSALTPSTLADLISTGWLAVRGALTAVLMMTGFSRKLLVFALFVGTKPAA